MKKRLTYIDIAKAIGIIAIVFGHVLQGGYLNHMVYAFHVPLFFFLSGFVFNSKDSITTFTKKRFKGLMIPYYYFGLISIVIYVILGNIAASALGKSMGDLNFSFLDNFIGMLYANTDTGLMQWNRPLWFLPCLFATSIITFLLEKYIIKHNHKNRYLVIFITALIGFSWTHLGIKLLLPLQLSVAINMVVWMELGISAHSYLSETDIFESIEEQPKYGILALIIFVLASVTAQFNSVNVMSNHYGNYFFYLINATVFIITILIISYYLRNIKFLNELGQHTLIILGLHKFPVLFFQAVLPFTKKSLKNVNGLTGIITAIVVTIISILLCLLADWLLQKIIKKFNQK